MRRCVSAPEGKTNRVSASSRKENGRRKRTESVEDTSKLNGNVPGPDDDGPLGQLLEIKETIAVNSKLRSLNVLGFCGGAADGNDNSIGRVLALDIGSPLNFGLGVGGGDGESVGVDEAGVAGDVSDVVFLDVCERPVSMFLLSSIQREGSPLLS